MRVFILFRFGQHLEFGSACLRDLAMIAVQHSNLVHMMYSAIMDRPTIMDTFELSLIGIWNSIRKLQTIP